jgi:N-acetylglucosaminyl-diphospho-decaprenol L-rhamnosyltransferase
MCTGAQSPCGPAKLRDTDWLSQDPDIVPAVFVAIVNYRTSALVIDCLTSLAPQVPALRGGRVIVVDNASGDDSLARIGAAIDANRWGAWAALVALPRNGGFAYGNNRAVERAHELDPAHDVVVLLNPDTVVRPGALRALLSHFESHPRAGIVGASIEDEHGRRQDSAHSFPSPRSEFVVGSQLGLARRLLRVRPFGAVAHDRSHACDWVSGACFAVRRQVFEQVGPLDEGYFLYFEEVDYCRRARAAGWECWYVADARVVHQEGSSTGIRDSARRRPGYWFASRRRYFTKAYGTAGLIVADLLWVIGHTSYVARRTLGLGGAKKDPIPQRFALDLLTGDIRAIVRGDLRSLRVAPPSVGHMP